MGSSRSCQKLHGSLGRLLGTTPAPERTGMLGWLRWSDANRTFPAHLSLSSFHSPHPCSYHQMSLVCTRSISFRGTDPASKVNRHPSTP